MKRIALLLALLLAANGPARAVGSTGAGLTLRTTGTNGYVVADAAKWVRAP